MTCLQVISTARTCNVILIVLDCLKPISHKKLIEKELEGFGIRLNKRPPGITFRRKDKGGVSLTTTISEPKLNLDCQSTHTLCMSRVLELSGLYDPCSASLQKTFLSTFACVLRLSSSTGAMLIARSGCLHTADTALPAVALYLLYDVSGPAGHFVSVSLGGNTIQLCPQSLQSVCMCFASCKGVNSSSWPAKQRTCECLLQH